MATLTLRDAIDRAKQGEALTSEPAHAWRSMQALTSTMKTNVGEADHSVQQSQVRAMGAAVMTLARQAAIRAVKRELQAQGLKPTHMAHWEIALAADAYLRDHRAELITQAKPIVARWQAEGFFGRAKLSSDGQKPKA